ncbi:MAG: c-type cytochrome domain-containing protein [Pelolinea sp.]|nr:c-type cytochrome domain-containing protein [Pelolinea sp.]
MEESAAKPTLEESKSTEEPASTNDVIVEVSFSQDVWPILEKYAVTAHGGKGGVFLESYSDILGNVVPGDPETSLLYKALIGDGMQQMPPGNPLPDEMIQMIYDWIKQGAKEN